MKMTITPKDLLKDSVPSNKLFADWLAGALEADFLDPEHQGAGMELERALVGMPSGPAPLFQSDWVSGWAASMATDLNNDQERALFDSQVKALNSGQADVVVTGQQPGYLGGPLYTLYKVATTVALARKRTAAGRPTFPVFWSGDDDDDLSEALEPVVWDPVSKRIQHAPGNTPDSGPGRQARILGRLTSDPWGATAARWLDQFSFSPAQNGDPLPADLAAIWRDGVREGWSWSRLARRSLLRVFQGCGLMVVSGDDPGLHEAAGPLYRRILTQPEMLADLATGRGRDLADHGWHAQISDRSVARPVFIVEDGRRTAFAPGAEVSKPGQLRPGVMLRSPIQDWLLRPAAVVAGPGELAYLRQLDPLYRELDIPRPPVVPRLFAWLLPAGFDTAGLQDFRLSGIPDPDQAERLASEAEEKVRRILADLLSRELKMEADRADALAAARSRRWRKGVAAMLGDEILRSRRERIPADPAWVFPDGMRQERRLAYLSAAALWGGDLVAASLEAAARHLDCGSQDSWREFVIEVPDP